MNYSATGIFLNANHDGYALYKRNGFEEITDFLPPTQEKLIDIDGTIPMLLLINDEMIVDIFT